jgi:hypothetical protein
LCEVQGRQALPQFIQRQRHRLKALSKRRGMNRLIDEMATLLLAEFNAEARFQIRAERGRGGSARGVELLPKARGPREGVDRPEGQTPLAFRTEGRVTFVTIWRSRGMRSGAPAAQ